jgi:hypothetical protein
MHTIRIVKCPEKGDSLDFQWIIFTFGENVGIVKEDYRKTALNLAKALLDVWYTVRVRQGVYKETKKGKNTIKTVGTEIDFNELVEEKTLASS